MPPDVTTVSPSYSQNTYQEVSSKRSLTSDDEATATQQDVSHLRPTKKRKESPVVQVTGLVHPRSFSSNYIPEVPVITEFQAINELCEVWISQNHGKDEHIIWKLENFSVYRPMDAKRHAGELTPLHALTIQIGATNELLFDGVLRIGHEKRHVQRIPFQEVTVEGYGDDNIVSLRGKICIRSLARSRYLAPIWYELDYPDPQYERYHRPYLWIAQLGKFFVDFLIVIRDASLSHFRSAFYRFLWDRYSTTQDFVDWQKEYGSTDFRQAVAVNIEYLWKECCGLDHEEDLNGLIAHTLWGEVRLEAVPKEPTRFEKTLATPFVYECFRKMPFATQMQVLEITNDEVQKARDARRKHMNLTLPSFTTTKNSKSCRIECSGDIRTGNVVRIIPHHDSKLSPWRNSVATYWYAYVQGNRMLRDGSQVLDILWLYEPKDTTLGYGYYPYQNELFMSDNCSCGQEAIRADIVVGIVDVSWFPSSPDTQQSFFVRQKYRTVHEEGAYDFVTLKRSDFRCHCKNEQSDMDQVLVEYTEGDTVLVRQTAPGKCDEPLKPGIITSFNMKTSTITLRRLNRARSILGGRDVMVNELVLSSESCSVNASQIVRRCYIRLFADIEKVSTPFDRGGAGDYFIIITDSYIPFLRQSDGPVQSFTQHQKLRGLSIFAGGGNFDRGLADGGAVDFHFAVDWATPAMHTYRANLSDTDATKPFLGSVNDYLAMAISGSPDSRVAQVGEIDFLAAGSPCPGFSSLQSDKQSEQSYRNCSLVAAVISQVEFYMPSYMILENVTGLASHPKSRPDLNVFSQILCSLVAMGYQVQQHLMDPTNYGSCQSRARIFIIATAPDLAPPPAPAQTHSEADIRLYKRMIGKSSNGIPFGERRIVVSPFSSVSVRQAMGDLPDISDAHVQTCIPFPDHRTTGFASSPVRNLLAQIPRWPHGMGFMQTYNLLHDPQHKRTPLGQRQINGYAWQNKHRSADNSRSWSRLRPDKHIGCLTTCIRPYDALLGRTIHWDQPRPITVMEARRAQGFLDSDVVLGSPTAQWTIIGNSVNRYVAFALGLSLGKAWLQTLEERGQASTPTDLDMADDSAEDSVEDSHR